MKIAIIDNRGGNILREEHGEQLLGSDLILYIEPDGHVNPQIPETSKSFFSTEDSSGVESVYIEAVHRDVISGEHSAEVRAKQIAERAETKASRSPAEKAAAAWSGPSTSEPESIHGPSGSL